MNEIVNTTVSQLPAHMQEYFSAGAEFNDDLSSGVSGGFGVLSIRAGMFRVKYQGDETVVRQDQNDEDSDPVRSMEVVFLKASPHLSKIYYAKAYQEGDDNAPDCFSLDGKTPDPSADDPQCETCAACPHNKFGSKITPAGKKAKACQDARRVAVAPAGDIPNEVYGGPMLLRVPAASLGDLAQYGKTQRQNGRRYDALVTRVSFDTEASFPKLRFNAVRHLNADELMQVYTHISKDVVERILETATDLTDTKPERDETAAQAQKVVADTLSDEGDLESAGEAPAPAPAARVTTKKKRTKKTAAKANGSSAQGDTIDDLEPAPPSAAAAPASGASTGDAGFDEELDGILDDLDDLG